MLNRLLIFSGLICAFLPTVVHAQQLKIVAETDAFTDYEVVNENLSLFSPYEIAVPVQNGTPQYQVLEQSVVDVVKQVSEERIMVLALSGLDTPLIQASAPANFRGQRISSVNIHIARVGENQAKIVRYLKLRVYKSGDRAEPPIQAKRIIETALADGDWYKIPIQESAIYALNREYLSELGIDISSVDPRKIQIWSTDGYPLAEANNQPRPEFTQLPILVEGEDDGSFDASDRVLFYGSSPHQVIRDNQDFSHQLHPYSDYRYVFLTIGDDNGERLSAANNGLNPARTINTFTDFIWDDQELQKPEESLKSGRYWLGRRFDASSNGNSVNVLSEDLPGIIANQQIQISGEFAARSTNTSFFDISVNNTAVINFSIPTISRYIASEGFAARTRRFSTSSSISFPNETISVNATYRHNEGNSTGFVDWLRIQLQRTLTAKNGQLYFYPPAENSPNEIVQYQLRGFASTPVVMDVSDVTDPKLLSVSQSGSVFTLNYSAGTHLQIIAQDVFPTPEPGSAIGIPNLRGITEYPEYIIVTAPEFLNQAEQLATYRQQELTSVIVTQEQIFNEFSGGAVDPSAIRDYVKFLYDRALADGQTLPKYLLLFGDATFDYKNILNSEFRNYVVTYQSIESNHRVNSFATDDFFGFLDDNEGNLSSGNTNNSQFLDIGIGRISAQTQAEASIAIQKIKAYENPQNSGDWQNLFTFAADDDFPNVESNRDLHTLNADETANLMNVIEPGIRINKVYELSYPEEISSSGRTIPGATDDFMAAMNNGTLVLNYSGHGNEQVLSDEGLFTSDYIPMLTNSDKLSILVTATCQFGRYDDVASQSGAEKLVLAENGGSIAAFTTTRVVYTSSNIDPSNNFGLNVALSQHMLEKNADGSPLRLGDIMMNTKNAQIGGNTVVASVNSKKFILIGDPAVKFQLPENKTSLQTINVSDSIVETDSTITIRALDQVQLTGQITDFSDNPITDFSGQATISVFDAPRSVSLPTDRNWVTEGRCYMRNRSGIDDCHYEVESDVLFKGKATIQNGMFSTTFIVPKDISFSDRTGRIIFYAEDSRATASGSFANVRFNGINPDAEDDGKGPELDVYLNDKRFVNGNLVNNSPQLVIELEDQSGINTTGTGVGHEIIATIDTKPVQSIVLNEHYEGDVNNYKRGRIEYPLDNLPDGNYTLKVRAWDVHNNPSEQEIFFEVASGDKLDIRNVYNYPNPMVNITRFTFEHNQPGIPLDVSVKIYTLSGRPVQHLQEQLITTSSYASISWDGRDRDYDRLANGTYIYVLRVTADTPQGRETTEKIEKLVIIR